MKIRISLMPTVVCGHSNLHKIKDKASGGFINGQKLVFLCLVTDIVSIPVGFEFYRPDPELKKWKKNDEKLRRQGVSKKNRPPEQTRNPSCHTIAEIALSFPFAKRQKRSIKLRFGE